MANTTKKEIKYYGTGRRKSAIVRVILTPGKGDVIFKNLKVSDNDKKEMLAPLATTENQNKFDVIVSIDGGGIASRIDAAILAISRALVSFDPDLKTTLRKEGYLTRDPREKERKKPGLRGARRAPQWAKR